MYRHFTVQNICSNDLLLHHRFNFGKIRTLPEQHIIIEGIYGHFRNWMEGTPMNYLSRYFIRWSVHTFLCLSVYKSYYSWKDQDSTGYKYYVINKVIFLNYNNPHSAQHDISVSNYIPRHPFRFIVCCYNCNILSTYRSSEVISFRFGWFLLF
jgi:hypothetical protein